MTLGEKWKKAFDWLDKVQAEHGVHRHDFGPHRHDKRLGDIIQLAGREESEEAIDKLLGEFCRLMRERIIDAANERRSHGD